MRRRIRCSNRGLLHYDVLALGSPGLYLMQNNIWGSGLVSSPLFSSLGVELVNQRTKARRRCLGSFRRSLDHSRLVNRKRDLAPHGPLNCELIRWVSSVPLETGTLGHKFQGIVCPTPHVLRQWDPTYGNLPLYTNIANVYTLCRLSCTILGSCNHLDRIRSHLGPADAGEAALLVSAVTGFTRKLLHLLVRRIVH